MEELSARLGNDEEAQAPEEDAPPPPPPGISLEEAEQLRATIGGLEEQLMELQADLAAKEDANSKLSKCGFLTAIHVLAFIGRWTSGT